MANDYQSGIGSKFYFTPDSTLVEVIELSNINWSLDESNRLAEVSNSQTGSHARRIACLDDTDGSLEVVFDSSLTPESVGLAKGATGSATEYFGLSGNGKTQDIIIEKVAFKAVVQQGAIMYTVTFKGNGLITSF